jgi:hypothetical protein
MAWPNASFVGVTKRGHRLSGTTRFDGGDYFDGTYDIAGERLVGTYQWRSGAQFTGQYDKGKEFNGTYTAANGWRLSGSFNNGRWHSGTITSPDGKSVFSGSVNNAGRMVGTRDERGINGRRFLNVHDDGLIDGETTFNNGDSYRGTFRPDDLLPLEGVYRFASNGTTLTGTFGSNHQLDNGKMEDPILMFPLIVFGGRTDGGDRSTFAAQGFVVSNPLPLSPPSSLPIYETVRSGGD